MIAPKYAVVIDESAYAVQWSIDDKHWQSPMMRLARLRMAKRRRKPIWHRTKGKIGPRNGLYMPRGWDA